MTQPPQRDERFLSRWSRLKRAHAQGEDAVRVPAGATPPGAGPMPAPVPAATRTEASPAAALPPLPPVESLGIDSDYAPFFQPRVPESLRRAAVKKLFADPHFNTMDGLDTYIDDYSKFEPIPEDMLRRLPQARGFFEPGKISGHVDEPLAAIGDEVQDALPGEAQIGSLDESPIALPDETRITPLDEARTTPPDDVQAGTPNTGAEPDAVAQAPRETPAIPAVADCATAPAAPAPQPDETR